MASNKLDRLNPRSCISLFEEADALEAQPSLGHPTVTARLHVPPSKKGKGKTAPLTGYTPAANRARKQAARIQPYTQLRHPSNSQTTTPPPDRHKNHNI